MNKFGIMVGLAAAVTLVGCKDPDYKRGGASSVQDKAVNVDTTVQPEMAAPKLEPKKCTCLPGTKHDKPCGCGAVDCACKVEYVPVVVPPSEPEYTVYIVQNGDYLAKISKKFNLTISSIKKLNGMKNDMVRVGQKLKLPGKIEVGEQKMPEKKSSVKAKKGYVPYSGATKEYVVKNGDTLGSIAYGNGINIRQLKEMNSLNTDALKIGQKLKIPAEKQVAAKSVKEGKKPAKATVSVAVAPDKAEADAKAGDAQVKPTDEQPAADANAMENQPKAEESPAPEQPATENYTVKENQDITAVSILFGVPSAEIRELNNLGENDQLVPGQVIKLPASAVQQ